MLRMILLSEILQIFHKNIAAFVLKYLLDSIYIACNSKICLNLDEKELMNSRLMRYLISIGLVIILD